MSVTPASLIIAHPEFTSQEPVRIQYFIDQASLFINPTAWDTRYDSGLTELACHMLSVGSQNGDAAPSAPVSDSVGGISTSYASPNADKGFDAEYSSTQYGRSYMAMRRLVFASRVIC